MRVCSRAVLALGSVSDEDDDDDGDDDEEDNRRRWWAMGRGRLARRRSTVVVAGVVDLAVIVVVVVVVAGMGLRYLLCCCCCEKEAALRAGCSLSCFGCLGCDCCSASASCCRKQAYWGFNSTDALRRWGADGGLCCGCGFVTGGGGCSRCCGSACGKCCCCKIITLAKLGQSANMREVWEAWPAAALCNCGSVVVVVRVFMCNGFEGVVGA